MGVTAAHHRARLSLGARDLSPGLCGPMESILSTEPSPWTPDRLFFFLPIWKTKLAKGEGISTIFSSEVY